MRYLNRIIFINSAQIKYAEINIDGNVHFTGTQGVGKSTILRAILFFYNADTQGLGIPKQKESYTDYYFKNANSYIVYEVCRDENYFCVVSYKSQHKVCFRFFDGAYNKDYFINPNGNVPDSWEGIARQLDQNRVFYSKRKIEEHKEYRDILYGNHDDKKKEYRRYSLLESKDYQYLPKTIQNVFLNSKMEAEFIKQTIIMSLGNETKIDLSLHAHHLEGFETQIEDIKKFKLPSTRKLAASVTDLYLKINYLEKEKTILAGQLIRACDLNEKKEPEYEKKEANKKEERDELIEKLNKINESFESKKEKFKSELTILQNELLKAKEAKAKYEKLNIASIIEKVNREGLVKEEKNNLESEKNLLLSSFTEVSLKYSLQHDQLQNQHKDYLNRQAASINMYDAELLNIKNRISETYYKLIEELRLEHKKDIDDSRTNLDHKKDLTGELKLRRDRIRNQTLYITEVSELKSIANNCEREKTRLTYENDSAKQNIETYEKQWTNDVEHCERTFDSDAKAIQQKISSFNEKIDGLNVYINNSKSSLFGWLNSNYSGWENTIGRVIDNSILFETSLEPVITGSKDTFYGIKLNLNQIDKYVKTLEDYQKDKDNLIEQVENFKKELSDLAIAFETSKENIKRRFQPKIAERKKTIKENEYYLQQNEIKWNDAKNKIVKFTIAAEEEKKKSLEEIENLIGKSLEEVAIAKSELQNKEQGLTKQIEQKVRERDKKNAFEQERVENIKKSINEEIKVSEATLEARLEEIQSCKNKELEDIGADTKRLDQISQQLTHIDSELKYIEANRKLVIEYDKDKRELLDRVEEFKHQKQKLEKQLDVESEKFIKKKKEVDDLIILINAEIEKFAIKLREIREGKRAFDIFSESECYKSLKFDFTGKGWQEKNQKPADIFEDGRRISSIIDEIKQIHYDILNKDIDDLRKDVNDLTGKFSENNLFKFKKQFSNDESYFEFALMLKDFIDENKIDRIEREVNERFALIITTIGRETSNLLSETGRIQGVVSRINKDFCEREIAVGVIKMIELKIEESKNDIFIILKKIKEFNDENAKELGSPNLFSSDDTDKKNKEAVDMLKQFIKKIDDSKKDYIVLSDSFDLKFRIEENQNDTGWVEKLSNVGSDGTDVLVKAMVNIMLLNVFKTGASRTFKDFKLHCMMDEIGKLHPVNVRGILKFANQRNIMLINGSPIENDALAFKHIYQLRKDTQSNTKVNRLITQFEEA